MRQLRNRPVNTSQHTAVRNQDNSSFVKPCVQQLFDKSSKGMELSCQKLPPLLNITGSDETLEPLPQDGDDEATQKPTPGNGYVALEPEASLEYDNVSDRLPKEWDGSLITINPNRIDSNTVINMDGRVYRITLDFRQPDAMMVHRSQENKSQDDWDYQCIDDGDSTSDEIGEEEYSDSFPPPAKPGSFVYKLQADLDIWYQAAKPKKGNYICTHCQRRFKTLYCLAKHLDSQNIKRPYRCSHSKCVWSIIGFNKKGELNRHVNCQHNKTTYQCPDRECLKCFIRKDALKRHIAVLHPNIN